jgi:hypothetical protein
MPPPPAGTLVWTSARVGPLGPRRRRRQDAGQAAALARVDLMRASHGQRRPLPFPSGPRPAGDHAARRPRGTSTGWTRPGRPATPSHSRVQRGADNLAALPRTGEACPSGHLDARTPGHRTRGHWTPDAWTLDVRSTGWTDIPTAGPDEADRATTGLAGVRTSWRPATTRWAARPRPGHGAWGRSAIQDGSAVTAPAPRPDRRQHETAAQHRPASGRAPGALLS